MRRRAGIRRRVTILATAVVALVLLTAGLSLVLVQRAILTDNLDQALLQRSADIVTLLESGQSPEEVAQGTTEAFAQLVTDEGAVVLSTPNLAGMPPLPIRMDTETTIETQTIRGLDVDDDAFRVLSRRIEGIGTLHIGTTFDVVSEASAALIGSLAVGIPLVVLALAMMVWWLLGRTLQQVEKMRMEVAAIGPTELDRRLPKSGTDDEIDRLAGTMNAMLERVESSVTRQQRFVADASHELRNPLTRIRSALEVEVATDAAVNRSVTLELLHEVISLQHMVDDMLYLARADEGELTIRRERVDLDDLVLSEVRGLRSRPDVTVDMRNVSGAQVIGDGPQLGRAVRNIVANAERHAESSVALSLAEVNGDAVLIVTDDGPGIPPDGAEVIFERFTRLDPSRNSDSGGTGLGLAIAREITQLHGGSLRLVANERPGATFEMRLPLAD